VNASDYSSAQASSSDFIADLGKRHLEAMRLDLLQKSRFHIPHQLAALSSVESTDAARRWICRLWRYTGQEKAVVICCFRVLASDAAIIPGQCDKRPSS
jgi:hypothetical protein